MTSDTSTTVPTMAGDKKQEATSAILDAASKLLAAEGPQALTMRRIATEAGSSTMNLYSRFGGKDGILEALFREGFSRLGTAMSSGAPSGDTIADLTRCGDEYRNFALTNPAYYSVMFDRPFSEFVPSEQAVEDAVGDPRQPGDAVVPRSMPASSPRAASSTSPPRCGRRTMAWSASSCAMSSRG